MRFAFLTIGIALSAAHLFGAPASGGTGNTRSFEMGMIYWPPQGEATSPSLVRMGIGLAVTNSDQLLVQLPWSPSQTNLAELASWISMVARENHKRLTIAIDWQDPTRTGVVGERLNPWHFSDAETRALFLRNVEEAATKHRPDLFVLGVEVNYYAYVIPDDFAAFVGIFHQARARIKELSPQTKVLVTF